MKRWGLWGILALLPAPMAGACSLNTNLLPFALEAGAAPANAPDETLQAPELKVTEITRGLGGAAGSCDGSGLLGIRLDWPRGDYKLDQVGFEFRVVGGDDVPAIFPAEPVAVTSTSRRVNLLFLWPDVPPGEQKPLRLELEVRAVTHGYLRGPPTRLFVNSSDL
ncbi:hypothetical protein [Pseudoxanthomonas indica]|uniref:Lipoprotein n=1 Tax=Pseudoxanthomonas indica TaxID=428993 RepID=A0A1T5LZH4_9GAMM|nr:hypothetical protein [Pseudoxanthomonas indica]GGD42877.1 hypothetical protein GCM10007235_13620 [Pseudoxanthomonas indica]SKC81293.1 hypothetical protein SAMN06296058_3491 [Pseudoxanthomonas indica]